MWIFRTCWLNFAQGPSFSGTLRFFNKPDLRRRTYRLKTLPEILCSGYFPQNKSIEFPRVSTREPWVRRSAHYSGTTKNNCWWFEERNCCFIESYIILWDIPLHSYQEIYKLRNTSSSLLTSEFLVECLITFVGFINQNVVSKSQYSVMLTH